MATGAEPTPGRTLIEPPEPGHRLGIFGGTFDPPHMGHVAVATDVADQLALDELIWMPANRSPHKLDARQTGAELRLAMVRAAVTADPRFTVDTTEIERPGPSYTVDTLRHLRSTRRNMDDRFILIMGADQYAAFSSWKDPEVIRGLATIAVMDRDGTGGPEGDDVLRVPVGRVDISSSMVRRRVAAGESIRELVPDAVASIIEFEGLYRGGSSAGDQS